MLISSNSLKRSFRKTSLSKLIKTTVVLTVPLAASIFETIIVIVSSKSLKIIFLRSSVLEMKF